MVTGQSHALVECVPNFSEGQRAAVMDAIQTAAEEVRGVVVLDRHADPVHNRMVLTFVGAVGPVAEAAFRCVARAADLIDMETHRGVHPRMGAADVLPFIPLGSTPMALCVELAHRVGRRIAAELDIPVYLYGLAAKREDRRRLPDLRRGEYEGLRAMIPGNPARAPDFGPPRLGKPGATAVGARTFLVAFNVTLATGDLAIARAIARAIRESSGGLPAVQARGFPTADPNVMQVSVNLVDSRRTPLHGVYERIVEEAVQRGVAVVTSELVGLAPTAVLAETTRHFLRLPRLDSSAAIETRLLETVLGGLAEGTAG
jgi:glutamate formiminotransferase / 5-formyltetrahydrofolate cyclo-ligase